MPPQRLPSPSVRDLDDRSEGSLSGTLPGTAPTVPGSSGAAAGLAARVHGARRTYGVGTTTVVALDDVTVGFATGEFTAIMGPSGSGRSTLLHCMAGLHALTSGHAFIGDTDLATLSDRELTVLRRDRLGFVFQAFNLLPTLTAEENITLPADLAGRPVDREEGGRRRPRVRGRRPSTQVCDRPLK
jgi:predicted ABC-type transport system involved in lysophospholipase L1 biosynthesis ATPase subunit